MMAAIKASELIKMLQEHVEKHGDDKVMIYDEYAACYKTFNDSRVSRNNGRFVIECEEEDED